MTPMEWMLIGRIAGAFGVRGYAKVDLHTDFPERFADLEVVYLGPEHRPCQIEASRLHGRQVVLKLRGVDTPEAVSRLRGLDIEIPRNEAVELPRGHYFLDDLIGVTVETASGSAVGDIADVLRTGSNDVYVVRSGNQELLIPGTAEAIANLDLEQRHMVVADWVLLQE